MTPPGPVVVALWYFLAHAGQPGIRLHLLSSLWLVALEQTTVSKTWAIAAGVKRAQARARSLDQSIESYGAYRCLADVQCTYCSY